MDTSLKSFHLLYTKQYQKKKKTYTQHKIVPVNIDIGSTCPIPKFPSISVQFLYVSLFLQIWNIAYGAMKEWWVHVPYMKRARDCVWPKSVHCHFDVSLELPGKIKTRLTYFVKLTIKQWSDSIFHHAKICLGLSVLVHLHGKCICIEFSSSLSFNLKIFIAHWLTNLLPLIAFVSWDIQHHFQ